MVKVFSLLCLSFYFTGLVSFSFVSHPVVYCVLLVFNALTISLYTIFVLGFSWYSVIFCLVYVGGVYILFIFASIYGPNLVYRSGFNAKWLLLVFFFFFFFLNYVYEPSNAWQDDSWYLCGSFEGYAYCFLCLVVLLGFALVSFIVSGKDSFFR